MESNKYAKISPAVTGKKRWVLAICLVLMLTIGVGATLAYFHLASGPVINTFQAGSVGADIYEEVADNQKKIIQVTNTGKSPVYVRVRLVSYYESEGAVDVTKASPKVTFECGDKWVFRDPYYYYNTPLAAGTSTYNLLGEDGITMEPGQVIEVLADTVQATPAQAVVEAWGVQASDFIGQQGGAQ